MASPRFTTWDIDNSGLQQLKKNIKSINSNHIEYGIINNEKYPATDDRNRAGMYVAEVAKRNEYGLKMPDKDGNTTTPRDARPYFYQSLIAGKQIAEYSAAHIFAMLPTVNIPELKLAMNYVAENLANSIRHSIDDQNFIPNAPLTYMRKAHRSTEILRDTDVMYNSFSGKVVKGVVPT